jgi:hypothetical protein
MMTLRAVPRALTLLALLAHGRAVAAPAGEHWEAVSTTAMSITGNVTFSPGRITFGNGKSLPLAPAGTIAKFGTGVESVTATLFRVTAPTNPVLIHGNRLCGGPVTFIAVWKPTRIMSDVDPRGMAPFSGSARPTGAGGPDFCGTYNYEAGR